MADVRSNNGPFDIESKSGISDNSIKINGPIGERENVIPLDANEKNELEEYLDRLIFGFFDRKIFSMIKRISNHIQSNNIDYETLMNPTKDETIEKRKKNFQETLRVQIGNFNSSEIFNNLEKLEIEYRNLQRKFCKGSRCDKHLVNFIKSKIQYNNFIENTREFSILTGIINNLKNIFYNRNSPPTLNLNITTIRDLLTLCNDLIIIISGFIGVKIERSPRYQQTFNTGLYNPQGYGFNTGYYNNPQLGRGENDKESEIFHEGGSNGRYSDSKDIKPWKGKLRILGLENTINTISDLKVGFYLAIIESFNLRKWDDKDHPSKTQSEINLRGESSEGGIERSPGQLKIYESTIFGNNENTISTEQKVQPFLVPPVETLANIFSKNKNENNYFKGLAEINNSLQSNRKFNDYFKNESTWPPYLRCSQR